MKRIRRSKLWRPLLLLILAGCDAKPDKDITSVHAAAVSSISHAKPSISLTPEEVAVFNIRLAAFADDAPNDQTALRKVQTFTGVIAGARAIQLQEGYDLNAAAADQRYRGNMVLISGDVKIVGGGDNGYHVRFDGGRDTGGSPRAEMADGHVEYLARLDKGQRITLACKGAGTSLGDAVLIECVPSAAYARVKVADLLLRRPINDIITTSGWLRQELILAVAYASALPKNSECARSDFFNDRCIALVRSIGMDFGDKSSNASERMTEFAFKKLGVDSW